MASFLLSYEVSAMATMHAQLLAFVKENRHVKQWTQPYAGLFLLKSDATVWALSESFQKFFTNENSYMLVPITAMTTAGIMPKYVWDWLNQPEQLGLAGLLGSFADQPKP